MLLARLFIENKLAEVNPSAATHLLVHAKMALSALMIHRVMCRGSTSWHGFIRYVNGIFACLWHVWHPFGKALLPFLYRLNGAERSIAERILKVGVHLMSIGKAFALPLLPCLLAVAFLIYGVCRQGTGIVIYHHFVRVPISFARHQHVCACIFEHGHEERQHVTLRIEVFYGLQQACALPLPAV